MKLSTTQLQMIASKVLENWKQQHIVVFKADEKVVLERMNAILRAEIQKEIDLDRDVNQKLEELERTNAGQFERYKMYPLLRKQMAKERKLIL
jgi:hypothetical protein